MLDVRRMRVLREVAARETPVRRVLAAALDGGYRSPATAAMLDVLREVAQRDATRQAELELVG